MKCLFELKVEFVVSVKKDAEGEEEEEVTNVLPEFEHDYDDDDYNFDVKATTSSYRIAIKKHFLPVIQKEVFMKFQPDLLAAHEPQLKHNTD